MRVVVDTNVLVSGLLNPHGAPGRIVDAILNGTVRVLFDDRIMDEYRTVLGRPVFRFRPPDISALLELIEASGEAVIASPILAILPDPGDVPFLEVALSASADALVTGNIRHFRPAKGRHAARIETPAAFVKRLAQAAS